MITHEIAGAWDALRFGGAMVYPLLLLGALAIAIMLDRAVVYIRMLRLPRALVDLVETYEFAWDELEKQLEALPAANAGASFCASEASGEFHGTIATTTPRGS